MLSRLAGGRYELEAVLGEGGMASVWRALDTRLGRSVAIKMLKESAEATGLQRLAEEARTVARLVHPNIVAVFDLGSEQGMPYLVMELVNGDSLRQRLNQGPLPISQVLEIGGQVCDALVAAHRAGVVHRDIKPDNILLTAADVVKVCDFGVAQLQPEQGAAGRVAGTTVGTSGYMAPEQAAGGPVNARTDLYALGCVFYAMLTGSSPFTGTDPVEVAREQAQRAAPRVAWSRPDVPPLLDAFVAELLAQDPADRPATAAAARERLTEIADAQPRTNETMVNPTTADRPTTGEPATVTAAWASAVPSNAHPTKAHSTKGAHRASARAAVVTRTQSMPVIDVDDRAAPRAGIRLGAAGIAGVAIGAAALTAVIIAAIMLGQSAQQVAAATTTSGPTTSGATSPTPTGAATGVLDAVRAAVTTAVDARRLEPGKAEDLLDRLDEIEGYLAEGETAKADEKIAEFRRRLAELRRDHDLSNSGYRAIVNSLDRANLPEDGGGRGRQDDG